MTYLSIACATILFYEYFLTFSDEVRYAWRGKKKTSVFLLFCMNRYLPIAYKIWDLSYDAQYQYGQLVIWTPTEVNSYLVLVTLLSQLFLALRVYAVNGRSKASVAILSAMTFVQLAYGVVYIAVFRRGAYTLVPLADPREYTFAICLADSNGTGLQLGYLALSLGFDVIAFVMIAVCSCKSANSSSSLFRRVVQDATVYFLMIVWVHLTVMIYVARMGSLKLKGPTATNSVIPVMICRLVLSLRKSNDRSGVVRAWNVDHFATQFGADTQQSVLLSPLRFQSVMTAAMSSERGTASDDRLMPQPILTTETSASDSRWTIDALEDGGDSYRERGWSIS
ncbi:hypothetical protein BJ322DRAFT_1079424 [Thelephora terrestris]|uniref:DUF6533 domain-containing protein n=1 Tax=Thelephora terrestris TaxID=56493 RepID=A0A9P6H945_9AGAM|nr:hypothetical protein BJ322DRAFT_1079424 [Thelephora terrestris]